MTEMMEWRAMLIVWRLQELAQFALREVARSQPPAVSFCSTLQPQLELLSIPAPCYCHAHRIHSHRQQTGTSSCHTNTSALLSHLQP